MATFGLPVSGNYTITYGWVPGVHIATDFAVPVGTPVLAIADGTVTKEGNDGALGDTLHLAHAGGYTSLYGNLTTYTVQVGDTVSRGQQIGTSGGAKGSKDAGDSTGPHLPLQIWKNGIPVNAAPLVGVTTGSAGSGPTATTASAQTNTGPFGIFAPFEAILNPTFWIRFGLGALGFAILTIALIMALEKTQTVQTAIKTGVTAAKDGAKVAAVVPK